MNARTTTLQRYTKEVEIDLELNVDGTGEARIETGLAFLDHMLGSLAKHARFDLTLRAKGDVHVDDHHTVEDTAIALGRALAQVLADRSGIARFGYAFAPLDEALARSVVDFAGRPWPRVELRLKRETIGDVATENLTHFLNSLAIEAGASLHVNVLCGSNDHHKAEAAFKATAIALRNAVKRDGAGVPSTKGVLS